MLVLSRRLYEKILFPAIDAAVQVVSIKPGIVRLGIEAPSSVKVLREELQARAAGEQAPNASPLCDDAVRAKLRELDHLLRNRLNGASIGLALLRRQLQVGLNQDA